MITNTWLVVLPPLIVLAVAVFFRNVIAALISGILLSAFIATNFSLFPALSLAITRTFRETHIESLWSSQVPSDHLYTFAFLLILGIIISLITHTGGIAAYTVFLRSKIHSKKSAQTVSLLLSTCFFIDDYLNSLTVGAVMRPLTDKFAIPRAKLAFLLDSMSAPLCLLVPATSWVAMVLANLQTAGVAESKISDIFVDPFNAYLHAIPYLFYPIFIVASAWIIVRKQISYGSMYAQEEIAEKTENLFGGKEPLALRFSKNPETGALSDFFIPIGTFIVTLIIALLYSGKWSLLGGTRSFLQALQEANSFFALFIASAVAITISALMFSFQRKLNLQGFKAATIEGVLLMKSSLLVLLLAWTLGSFLKNDLRTGEYLGSILLSAVPGFLLPLIVLVTSTLVAASTGSAWGTISVMLPLSIPLVVTFSGQQPPLSLATAQLLSPVLGALLSGSVAGAHMSPISDSTVLASTSAGCYHLDHVTTQFSYVIPAIIGSLIATLLASLLVNYSWPVSIGIPLVTGLLITISILFIRNKKIINNKKA